MKLVYFAWVRERVGKADEVVDLPAGLATVADLLRWLRGRGEEYAYAFEGDGVVRVAIDRVHAKPDASLAGATEIAFFPPMTGG
ncbi:molybdopterin converting factor subunit 1 [Methylobacterium sp. J-090]|uniref:molybdopterin converting factor subunit 1 n=1 Tax=Methylobacterium sp. J-090 TaxID=2836666 RepID=UPI001FB96713|nr:molybdopterin converting factor subunit 1 [Methylobacterium sp. J-090]MCJ2083735.1 molybdopterin converting factor subunit 1 [Methylobacterium sp. J-090]